MYEQCSNCMIFEIKMYSNMELFTLDMWSFSQISCLQDFEFFAAAIITDNIITRKTLRQNIVLPF